MAKPLRIPAGVRIDGEGVGGRFVSPAMLPILADATDATGRAKLLRLFEREAVKAQRAHERAERKFDDDPRRFAEERAATEAASAFWRESAREIEGKAPREIDHYDELYDEAAEWELGCDYRAASGPHSNVDINIRIRRTDGRAFGFQEARTAFANMRGNLSAGRSPMVPPGYRVAAINWKRPRSGSPRWGTVNDLENFANVLYVAADDDTVWRLGSVE